ncbi:hypothetical protein AC579_8194, partial [Pseudocercospora musae]
SRESFLGQQAPRRVAGSNPTIKGTGQFWGAVGSHFRADGVLMVGKKSGRALLREEGKSIAHRASCEADISIISRALSWKWEHAY